MTMLHFGRRLILLFWAGLIISTAVPCYAADLIISLDVPYSLGQKKTSVLPGESFHALFSIENTGDSAWQNLVEIQLPRGFALAARQERWQVQDTPVGQRLTERVELNGGYGQWFDLLTISVETNLPYGTYPIQILAADAEPREYPVTVAAQANLAGLRLPVLERVVLPLERDGKRDEKLSENTLVLRDRSLDYYKNILRGKGAANLEIEAIHPISHMGLDFANPSGQQKVLKVVAELLDPNTRRPVRGLYTPGSSGDNEGAGAMTGNQEHLSAMAALNGEVHQRLILPVYADETMLAEGHYLLKVTAEDGESRVWSTETPVTVVKKNLRALGTLGIGLVLLLAYSFCIMRRGRLVLTELKTRRLITVALFGTCAFAVVSVPATLFNDFFHVLLGPFGFLITGMFSGVVLYMLTGALITLMPLQGVPSLMAATRFLLGMLAFGHISPIMLLSTGVNAFLLEVALSVSGVTCRHLDASTPVAFSARRMVWLALACALADTVATYVGLQGMAVLYRYYYADWYIYMMMAVNGFLYTMIGALCGVWLGKRLADVGSD